MASSGPLPLWKRPNRPATPIYLTPSSAPKARTVSSPVPISRRRNSPARPIVMRPMSPEAAKAIAARNRTNAVIAKVDRRLNPDEGDGGILGAITAPFRVGGEVLSNAVTEARQIIPGTARLVYETVKDTGQVATGGIPGTPWSSGQALERIGQRTGGMLEGLGRDIRFVGGPILRGDPAELASRLRKEPIRVIGTAALGYSAAGAAVRAAAKGGAVAARATGAGRTAEALREFGSKRTVAREPGGKAPRRQRAPEVINAPAVDQYGRTVAPGAQPVIRQRRPRSANPITREIQRAINDRVVNAVRTAAGSVPIVVRGKNINPVSPAARYNRIIAKDSRNAGTQFVADFENDFLKGTQTFQKIVRSLPHVTGSKQNAKAAGFTAAIRSMGLNNLGKTHTSRTWGRDELIRIYEDAKSKTDNPLHVRDIEDNIQTLRTIPDHWLDPDRAPKVINDLTKSSTEILNKSTQLKIDTGLLKPETAALSGRRGQAIAAGVFPQFRALQEARKISEQSAAAAVELRGKIAGINAKVASIQTRAKASGKPLSAAQAETLRSYKADANRLRLIAMKFEKRAKRNDADATRLYAEVGTKLDWEMSPGAYFPNVRKSEVGIKNRKRLTGRPVSGESSRMTAAKEFENKGIILRDGTAAFGPDVTLAAFRNALDLYGRQRAVEALVTKYVVKDANGLPITDAAAVKLAESSSDLYVARSKEQLIRTLASNDKSAEAKTLLDQIKATDKDTKYLIPKSVETGWKQALGTRRNALDQVNSYWKAGVLALSPRWYMQNLIGMWSQFLLGAGADLQAIRMAKSPKYRDAVVSEIEGHGLASDLGEFARRQAGKEGRGPIRRVVDFGYKWNAKFEALPRRAMYFHAVKKKLAEEEMAAYSSSAGGLSEAWLNVTQAAKRGEQWADDLIGQVTLETERFMGNYTRYNNFERVILRRAFPFYGWMRAIHRLAFALPVKYPKRAALLAAASRMAYEMYSDNESTLLDPIAGIVIGKNRFLGTSVTNPFETLSSTVDLGANLSRDVVRGDYGQAVAAVGQQVYPQINPLVTALPTIALNRSPLNIPLNYGYGSEVFTDPLSKRSYTIDPTTGEIVDAQNEMGIEQIVGRNFPIYNLGKRLLAGGTPTESATLGALLNWRLSGSPARGAAELVQAARPGGEALTKDLVYDLTNSLVGLPLYKYSAKNALIQSLRDDESKRRAFESYQRKRIEQQKMYEKLGVR